MDILDKLVESHGMNAGLKLELSDSTLVLEKDYVATYLVACFKEGTYYIGSTASVKKRFRQHRYNLRTGVHSNANLQRVYDSCGEEYFSFFIFPRSTIDDARDLEQSLLNLYHGEKDCLNISNDSRCPAKGYDRSGVHRKLKEYNSRPEVKARLSNRTRKMWADKNKRRELIASIGDNVTVDGIPYGSVREASRETGYSIQALRRVMVNGVIDTANIKPYKRKVFTDGLVFESLKDAADHHGVKDNTLHYRINSGNPKWNNYYYM